MRKFDTVTGVGIPLRLKNVDTDVIISAKFLKVVTRTGLGQHAFETLRAKPDNIFDNARNSGAPILIAGANFGCGSSREHAPWALVDMGIRVIIAPSFADIFAGNAVKNGILLVALPQPQVDRLLVAAAATDITVDLTQQLVTIPTGNSFAFEIDPFRKACLIDGLDEIALTEQMQPAIDNFEKGVAQRRSWIADAARRAA